MYKIKDIKLRKQNNDFQNIKKKDKIIKILNMIQKSVYIRIIKYVGYKNIYMK